MPKNFKFGACVVAGGFAWAIIMMMVEWTFSYGNDESPEEAPAESVVDPVDEAVTTQPIGLLLARLSPLYISAPEDELGTLANSICQRAERLLAYRKEDGVIGEILQAYRVFIEQYIARAVELVRKHQMAKEFLRTVNYEKVCAEFQYLQGEVGKGDASVQKTAEEKQRTKVELEAMQASQVLNEREMQEIDATLEAMETIAVSAETNNADAKYISEQLQQTISTTSRAIKETLCAKGSCSSVKS